MPETHDYAFAFTDAEARRLIFQGAYWSDITETFLRQAGLSAGMRVLDAGSGAGDVAMCAARLVGPRGAVLGLDRSPEAVALARSRAAAAGLDRLRFTEATFDAFDTPERFDALIGRLVLLHQPLPADVLRHLARLLIPGGIVAFQEPDLTALSAEPATPLATRLRDRLLAAFGSTGLDLRLGAHLPRVFVAAGLPIPHAVAAQLVTGGPDSPEYAYLAQIQRTMLPLILRQGLATEEEIGVEGFADRLREDSLRHDVIWSSIRMVGAWTRLPAL